MRWWTRTYFQVLLNYFRDLNNTNDTSYFPNKICFFLKKLRTSHEEGDMYLKKEDILVMLGSDINEQRKIIFGSNHCQC